MRRVNPISVRVKGPSRGLVTRLPPDEADAFRPQDLQRVATVAQNVRYEDGVIANAQGYSRIQQITPLLVDLLSHWRFEEESGTRKDSAGTNDLALTDNRFVPTEQVVGKIGKAVHFPSTESGTPHATLSSNAASLLALPSADCSMAFWLKLDGHTAHRIISAPGMKVLTDTAGKITVQGGTGSVISTSSLTIGVWYFVAFTHDFTTGSVTLYINGVSEATGTITPFVTFRFTIGNVLGPAGVTFDSFSVWTRKLTGPEITTLYNSTDGLDYPFNTGPYTLVFQGNLITSDESTAKPTVAATSAKLWSLERGFTSGTYTATLTEIFSGTGADERFPWLAQNFYNKIIFAQHDNDVQYFLPADSVTRDLPGLSTSDSKWDGAEVFFGHLMLWKEDRLKWSDRDDFSNFIPVGATAASVVLTLADAGGGTAFTQPALGGTVTIPTVENPTTAGLVAGQFIRLDDDRGGDGIFYNFYVVASVGTTSFDAVLQSLTGATAPASAVAAAQQMFSLDANEAGEAQIVGSDTNGVIYRVLAQGDYAYIFKERSILSVQYVGLQSGTFFIHPEVVNEGLLSRSAILGRGDGTIVFVGHREIYEYQGGPNLKPVCRQFSRQMYAEMDRTRLHQIVLYHNEFKNEIWIQYPVLGGFKVLIWNYFEDTASIDLYDPALKGFAAITAVEWSTDPEWLFLAESELWETFDQTVSWESLVLGNKDRITVLATGAGDLFVHGTGFERDGAAYTALSETQDYDFGEPDLFKYVDVVVVGLQVRNTDNQARKVYIQVGQRASLDQTISWTTPQSIQVQGNYSPSPIKVNPGGAGRFLRLRFYSEDKDVEWRITSFEIHARPGGFY